MQKFLRTVLFTLLALGVLAALLWFGNARTVLALVDRFQRIYLLWFFLVLLAYEAARGLLWYVLLGALARVPARTAIFAFTAGEAAKFIPTGAYLQNYLLQRSRGTDFGRTSAATTVIILGEILVALLGVAVIGVGGWSTGLRIAIIVLALAAIWPIRHYLTAPHETRMPRWVARRPRLRTIYDEIGRFRAGAAALARPRIILITLLLSIVYVFLAGASLYLVVRALGLGVSLPQAVAVNCFGLAFYLILGSIEAAEVGVFVGIGVKASAAVTAILVMRGLSIGLTIVCAFIVLCILRGEWRAVLRPGHDQDIEEPPLLQAPERGAIRGENTA